MGVRYAAIGLVVIACSAPEDSDAGGTGGKAGHSATGGGAGTTTTAGTGGSSGAAPTNAGGSGGSGELGGSTSAAGAAGEATIGSGECALEAPAFCDTFEEGPIGGPRAGELDGSFWSVLRAIPSAHPDLESAYEIQPALMPECKPGVTGERAVPDADTVICEPTATIATQHFLGAVAAQNYGLNTYRIRQPFDFAGRTGTIAFDADLSGGGLYGWPAVSISEDPSPAPTFEAYEHGSGARNGVLVEFDLGWCNTPDTKIPRFWSTRDYVETEHEFSWDCGQAYAVTKRDSLNHVEIRVNKSGLEVWASDVSPDGVTFPNFKRIGTLALELPFERGYVSLVTRNHATLKYWNGPAWWVRWDNVGFDGPVIGGTREFSAPEPLGVTQGIAGCTVDGACVWHGQVILDHPDDDGWCSEFCDAEGEGRTVGWVVPNEDETPVRLELPDVRLDGVTAARLVWAADYPWFEWNGVFPPPTALNLRYRLNGGDFHDHFVNEVEANAFGGEEKGAGLLNQVIEVDPAELVEGTNVLELSGSGTWTGAYRMGVVGVDLLLSVAE